MRSNLLNLRVLDHRFQSHIIPAKYGSPIPVWGQDDGHIPIRDTGKLRQFCLEHPVDLSPSPTLRLYPGWFKMPLRAIALIGIGTCLGLSAPTSPVHLVGPPGLGIAPSVALNAGETQAISAWQNSLGLNGKKEFTSNVAVAGISPQPSSWTYPGGLISPRFVLPVEGYPMTSGFGNRIHPIFGDTRFHNGIDLGTPIGTPIRASASGSVSYADWDGGYGKAIVIQHVGGYETLYAHLDQFQVKVGDRVRNGQIIGLSGSTGYVTGPHLHFEIRRNEIAYNPLDYF
jgi:hypothetical protein